MSKLLTEEQLEKVKADSEDFSMEENGIRLDTRTVTEEASNPFTENYYKHQLEELVFQRGEVVNEDKQPGPGQIRFGLYQSLMGYAHQHRLQLIRSRVKRKGHVHFQIGLVTVDASGNWEPVEVCEHPAGLTQAGAALLITLKDRGY